MRLKLLLVAASLLLSFSVLARGYDPDRLADEILFSAERLNEVMDQLKYDHRAKVGAKQEIERMRGLLTDLEMVLFRPAPVPPPHPPRPQPVPPVPSISATCSLEVGGNFFTPDTKVHCTVYGAGAAGYEVRVIGDYRDSIEFQGQLNPGATTQTFVSQEKRVGGYGVTYIVNILTTTGHRVPVAQMGKPR